MTGVGGIQGALKGKKLLIFDFDGTLADTSPLHASAFSQTLQPLGVPVHYPDIAGLKTADAFRRCMSQAGQTFTDADLAELTATKQRLVRQLIAQHLEPLPGVDEFLRWARPRYQLALVTSGSRGTVELSLTKLGYSGWFEPVVFAEDVRRGKPDPEGFQKVLNLTGIHQGSTLVFEDSDSGLVAAEAAQLPCIDVRSWPFSSFRLDPPSSSAPAPVTHSFDKRPRC